MLSHTKQRSVNFLHIIGESASCLWKAWPKNMELVSFSDSGYFTLRGECPHCSPTISVFQCVPNPYEINGRYGFAAMVGVAKCAACLKFILGAVVNDGRNWEYDYHYPVGEPNDEVPKEVPEHIREEFGEAIRCHWVRAYSATAEMCRRAVEAACLDLGANYDSVLEKMIDELEEKRIITPALKKVAHQVRFGGNRGAHPIPEGAAIVQPEPVTRIEEEHAEALVSFTRHFLEHVYVIPNQLPKFDFSRVKLKKQ